MQNSDLIVEKIEGEKETITFTWHPERVLVGVRSHQVYGICFNNEGKICVVRDEDEERFTPPGGRIDEGEDGVEGMIREFQEEAQFTPENIELLGVVEVKVEDKEGNITDHHQQHRYLCSIADAGDFEPLKDGFEIEERKFITVEEAPSVIEWIAYPTGKAIWDLVLEKRGLN